MLICEDLSQVEDLKAWCLYKTTMIPEVDINKENLKILSLMYT